MTKKIYGNKIIRITLILSIIFILMMNLFNVQAYADEKNKDDKITDEITTILNEYYIEDISQDIKNGNSVMDIIQNINDPYTQVMNMVDYNKYLENSFFGIGVTIDMLQAGAAVDTVMINSPAMRAGLFEGDIILAVDDKILGGLSVYNALSILNGKAGTSIRLRVLRDNYEIDIVVTPGKVYYPTIQSKIIDNHIAYIQIISFGENTLEEFKYKMNSLDLRSVDSFIIDIRNNPGGYINNAIQIAGYFVKNNTVAIAKNKHGVQFKLNANKQDKFIDKPVIFLVNKYTASASELLAACVQDYDRALLIGETTYGKGVAQSTFNLTDGSILKVTTLKLFTPGGREINDVGIPPDIRLTDFDPLKAAELLLGSISKSGEESKLVKVVIKNKEYLINITDIDNLNYWEAYRQIISQASLIDASSQLNAYNSVFNNYPVIKYKEVPRTQYKVGERVAFKLSSPNYNGLVQYRAMLWDENTSKYIDLWNTKDKYYDKWKPRGKDIFTVTFPIFKAGNYKIKFFVKRSGIENSKAFLKGMNCDSFVYEIPFKVIGS